MSGAETGIGDGEPRGRAGLGARGPTDPLDALIDILPLPVLLARTDDDVIVQANGMLARALGSRTDELIGGPTSALFYSPADRDHCRGAIVRDGRVGDYELQLRRSDGRPFWAVLWAASVEIGGRPAELLTFYDSTAAAQTELLNCRLKTIAIHEREMQTLGTVTAGIAHDLNSIIKPLVNYSDLALRHVPPGSRAYSGLEQVVEAAQHARVLARQILSFSRQDSGRGEALHVTAARGNERLLVVEDREELAGVLERMLGRLGYRVTTRTRPADALKMFREEPRAFDAVVTDQSMPEMTGVELAGELKRIRSDVPIILISGFKDAAVEQSCLQVGVRELIMKPIVGADVGRAIRRALDVPATTGDQPQH
jgi:CheY-like chemotaxis protein